MATAHSNINCAHLPPPIHPAREVINALSLAVFHLTVRHDRAVVHVPRIAPVPSIDKIRDLRGAAGGESRNQGNVTLFVRNATCAAKESAHLA